ncbi:FAD-dependent oxidoreductase [Candidatus Daviesbacteria bacterium]|nr:FAD-dependent oxidoreductase [Candidatus Daviesbacteria bacterium]
MNNKYDVIVIGGGSAGFSVLEQIAHKGLKIALVENRKLGGSCPNFACVPSKALIKCAEVLHTALNADKFGINVSNIGFDWKRVQEFRAGKVANTAAAESEQDLKEKEVDLIWGTAKFISASEIEVDGKIYSADKFAITTGSRPLVLPIDGLEEIGFLDSDQGLQIDKLPKSLTILGAGPVGIEIAQMFARFGVKVAVINRGGQILGREEPEVANLVQGFLEKEGVEFLLNAQVKKVMLQRHPERSEGSQNLKLLEIEVSGQKGTMEVEQILVAPGRIPNIDMLDLKKAGVKTYERGIVVDEYMQTSQPHIYSAGDVAGIMLFTHAASYEGFIIGQNLLGNKMEVDHKVIPRGTFSDPEVGSVGIMEKEARDKGLKVQTALMDYTGGRGDIQDDPLGLTKVTVDAKTRQILGASVVGRGAAEFVHMIAMAMHHKIKVDDLDTLVYAFPTYAEGLAGITSYLKD